MKNYVIVDKNNGNINSIFGWGNDGMELPSNYPHLDNEIIIHDIELDVRETFKYCYDLSNEVIVKKPIITCDKNIMQIGDVVTISIDYQNISVNEICYVSIDSQSVDIDIVNGLASFPYTSNVIGSHNIVIESSTCYGKQQIHMEVIV